MKKVLVIVGPTASGKSDLAVRLAKKFNGEIISADSRQVYRGLNIGTGKITKKEMRGVPHHLLDVTNPKKQFSAAKYKKLAEEIVRYIVSKNKLPIIVGGTGFYIDALTGTTSLPDVPPNKLLRSKLEKLDKEKLFKMLEEKDPARAKTIDRHNKVRLIRALEIVNALGKVPALGNSVSKWQFIYIGLKLADLDKRIYKRLLKRIPGIIRETRKLSPKRAHELGLEYRFASLYLRDKLDKQEFIEKLYTAIRQYAKRQMTWFKKNKKIKWFKPGNYREIERYVRIILERGD
ncbi:MAG: tRNA dimethylallyltransferase [Parcubacteria group bacterium GW2011_GWB1_49_7]|uniref:tRNA dimethylallyltransferase n=1 Tax=Candidatus Zambryskibacteria bacterium RIFCSPHIGHO2_01_FULL_46_25 TaxID=1802738 RepID=A0A1G2SZF3_9BACT|nr:MAG: tRNA dimethylallyltransferase [Parcubacteria group bacterium GW2011_GWA1_47_10]KKW10023.1 MAG: tRNA dimethylallyltransferase [Parcubacteria group bacterium GW2011_GWB1_49_7]OHA90375.1 MAG: tRNA (adenosine(37)-N6)-dimethylallyltransferase MiaA [Candidatus Zambryskibacteria bacterium RIFCSPHIGHO2_01_FULL_46_25]OHB01082.1 MAG: tRNA (adenosine(37)-N6)-dimethylallyltransferase MiaA [Candidatus Zambryskibacteria bacterium RIFCSPHIGHO2_12_FULL_48_10]OHB06912.1 MAG: tRNA (adenosine(37)-N6)-dime